MSKNKPAEETPVESPCINVCELSQQQVCIGCGRHVSEVALWGSLSNQVKSEVLRKARTRLGERAERKS
ncbi:DUF1289 domain-containing protein [Planctomycetaceae bacterium SH139]